VTSLVRATAALACAASLAFTIAPASAGCGFQLFPTVDPNPNGNQLVAVGGAGATDLWEAGATFHRKESRGYAIHWNGSAWDVHHESNAGAYGGQLSGIVEVSPTDVWSVGQQYAAPNYGSPQALIEHWDGRRFKTSTAPLPPSSESALYGVAALASNDVWAAGVSAGSSAEVPLFEHWDGSAWSMVPGAAVAGYPNVVDAIGGDASTDVWAVGGYVTTSSGAFQTLAEHWDGTQWSVVPTPNVNGNSNIFNAVVVVGPNDVWAVGDYYNGQAFATLTEHWNGYAWSIVPSPNYGAQQITIYGAGGRATDAVWAAGETITGPDAVATFVMEWDGSAWNVVPSANRPDEPVTLFNAIAALPDGSVWAAGGDANKRIVVHTVTEDLVCAGRKVPPRVRR
jgi:hypothetical protein